MQHKHVSAAHEFQWVLAMWCSHPTLSLDVLPDNINNPCNMELTHTLRQLLALLQ